MNRLIALHDLYREKHYTNKRELNWTHTHTHTCSFLWKVGTSHRRNGFYTVQTVCAIALHLPYT